MTEHVDKEINQVRRNLFIQILTIQFVGADVSPLAAGD
jgi:hypothetical protein